MTPLAPRVLMWEKPERIMSVEKWKEISACGQPPGVYTPNMSQEDRERWKAKLVGHKAGRPHVEIRKTIKGVQLFLLVSLGGGYKYRGFEPTKDRWGRSTVGINVHLSLNGSAQLTFDEWNEMRQAVEEAKAVLEEL